MKFIARTLFCIFAVGALIDPVGYRHASADAAGSSRDVAHKLSALEQERLVEGSNIP